jgi:hypothetical protein
LDKDSVDFETAGCLDTVDRGILLVLCAQRRAAGERIVITGDGDAERESNDSGHMDDRAVAK